MHDIVVSDRDGCRFSVYIEQIEYGFVALKGEEVYLGLREISCKGIQDGPEKRNAAYPEEFNNQHPAGRMFFRFRKREYFFNNPEYDA